MDYDATVSSPEFASVMRDPSSLVSVLAVLEEEKTVTETGESPEAQTPLEGNTGSKPLERVNRPHTSYNSQSRTSPLLTSSIPSAEHLFTPSEDENVAVGEPETRQSWADEVILSGEGKTRGSSAGQPGGESEHSVLPTGHTSESPPGLSRLSRPHRRVLSGDVKPFVLKTGASMFPRSVLLVPGAKVSVPAEPLENTSIVSSVTLPAAQQSLSAKGAPAVASPFATAAKAAPTAPQSTEPPKGKGKKERLHKHSPPLKNSYQNWVQRLENTALNLPSSRQDSVPGAFFGSEESSTVSYTSAKTREDTSKEPSGKLSIDLNDVGAVISTLSSRISDLEQAQARHERECAQELESLTKRLGGNWSGSSKSATGVVITGQEKQLAPVHGSMVTAEGASSTVESVLRLALRSAKGQPQRVLVSHSKQLIKDLLAASNASDFSSLPSSVDVGLQVLKCQSLADALVRVS